MPAIKPDRLLGDLYKLRTFGTFKTGVHRRACRRRTSLRGNGW
jgi:hypothetical protein